MMFGGMMFGKVVGAAQNALALKNVKLLLADVVANPIKLHVHCFGALLLDCVIGNANECGVVGLQRCRRLRVTKFVESDANRTRFLGIVEDTSHFGFRSTGKNFAHNLAGDVNGTIARRWQVGRCWCKVGVWEGAAQEMVTSIVGECLAFQQVGCIAVDLKDHFTGDVTNDGIGICVGVDQ